MNNKGLSELGWIAIFFAAIISVSIVWTFWLAPAIFLAEVDSAHDIIDKTYDADNAIANYEWFKTQHEKIQAAEKQIDITFEATESFKNDYGDPKEFDWQTRQEYDRIKANLTGQKLHYEDLVATYNARSEMANREIFKNKLPFNVDKKIW